MKFSELTDHSVFSDFLNRHCPVCMCELGEGDVCPRCFRSGSAQQAPPFLPAGCPVGGRYIIGALLSGGGDGNTYAAFDADTQERVFLREFFPDAVCMREEDAACSR